MPGLETLVSGLCFPEGLRWHEGQLWFSDFYQQAVFAVAPGMTCKRIVDVPMQPSGLGWLPDGDLLVVSMKNQHLLRWDGEHVSLHADLSGLARFHCNDMVTLASGHAYVGCFGFDPWHEPRAPAPLIHVAPDGRASIAVAAMDFPNGLTTLDDERILIVAESTAKCLAAFDIGVDGQLNNRRLFAATPGVQPDGICIDAKGNIRVTTMTGNRLLTFSPLGELLDDTDVGVPVWSVACGHDGALYLATSPHFSEADCRKHRSGAIQRLS